MRRKADAVPRNISFALTIAQFRDRKKSVTRRLGWKFLYPGDELMGVEKSQGVKAGEIARLGPILVTGVRREPLSSITPRDVIAEGFPGMSPAEFVAMFSQNMKCRSDDEVTRIEYKYLDKCWVCGKLVTSSLPILGRPERVCLVCDRATERTRSNVIGKAVREYV